MKEEEEEEEEEELGVREGYNFTCCLLMEVCWSKEKRKNDMKGEGEMELDGRGK